MTRKFHFSAGVAIATVLAVPACLSAQTRMEEKKDYPKSELFVGYSYLRAVPTLADGNRLVTLNGGSTSLAYNFTRHFGLVTDFSGYADSELRLSGPGAIPTRIADSSGSVYSMLFGPRFSFRAKHFTPFVQVLGGGAYATAVTLKNCTTACTPLPEQGSFAMTAGGGLDVNVSRHLAIRAVQAEYLMTRFANTTTAVRSTQNDMRLSAGLVFRFGSHPAALLPPNRAPLSACSVDKSFLYSGSDAIVAVHAKGVDADNDALTYAWTPTDGTLTGTGADVKWDLTGAPVGSHIVKLKLDDGRGGSSDCAAEVVIAAPLNRSPSLSCSIAENALEAGQLAHLTATGSDPDGDPLQYTWTTSYGAIRGTDSAVLLQTDPTMDHAYAVHVQVMDGRGGSSDCSMNFSAQRSQAVVKLEERLSLRSIYFPTAEPTVAQPSRGLLASQHSTLLSLAADFSQYLKTQPTAHLILEGHADPRGSAEYNQKLSELRVALTKEYLVAHGIAAESIDIKARGDQQNLTDGQVKDAILRTPELSEEAKKRLLLNMKTIILASNRRVDVTLSTTNQHSIRQYPFNASDSMTLLSEQRPGTHSARARAAVKR
ncbi:OmpA family protein [Terriglobus roseus]|uniref:Outer membrane protein OmpA n=1 Tax=Terriglobus roseus TaxID=392734 RepID=A0A1H4JSY7_9BACT|nr:OmpA family protein [Terriglobus roseus]SEB49353.1 Outer membrane protein OmpA [Terriglobus roseus]